MEGSFVTSFFEGVKVMKDRLKNCPRLEETEKTTKQNMGLWIESQSRERTLI